MKSKLERYVESIVNHTECHEEDKEEMYNELLIHLELSKGELIRKGFNEKEAELKAIELFGSEKEIGNELQQSIFPYKRQFMLTLSIASFVFTISVYLLSLFQEGDAFIGWLILSMSINSILLLMALNQVSFINRRRWVNIALILHILVHLYGYGIVSGLVHTTGIPLSVLGGVMILLALILVYQTTIYGINLKGSLVKEVKRLHQLNFVLGLISISSSLFMVWSVMLFGGFQPFMLLMASPLFIWGILYVGQMKWVKKDKRVSLFLASLSILMNVLILFWFIYPFI